jgi:hypothetical protein
MLVAHIRFAIGAAEGRCIMKAPSSERAFRTGPTVSVLPSLSRRNVLGLALGAGAVLLPKFARAQSDFKSVIEVLAATGNVKRFTQSGGGGLDGSTWADAMPISWLSKSLALADGNAAFLVGFDPQRETPTAFGRDRQISIRTSGTASAPIALLAGTPSGQSELEMDGSGTPSPQFVGHPAWTLATYGKQKGPPCFVAIERGASHLLLAGFSFTNSSGDGFIKFRAGKDRPFTFDSVHISGLTANSAGRAIETDRGATLTNHVVEDCRAKGLVRGFGRFRNVSQAVFRRLELDADHMDAGVKNPCQLIAIESGDNILLEDVTLENAIASQEGHYVQGDGLVCERKTSNLTLRRCHGKGMGDAAFDLKTTNVTMEECTTDDCKFGARIWTHSSNRITDCTFTNPAKRGKNSGACVQASGQLEIVNSKFQAGTGASVIALHMLEGGKPPHVRITGGSVQLDGSGALATTNAKGTLELQNVLINGEMRSGTFELDHNLIR